MVSKRLNGHYLRSYEQIKKNRFLFAILRQLHKSEKKFIEKLDISSRKLKKRETPNRVNPYLKLSLRGPATQPLNNEREAPS